jgi:hypothetical protein
MFWLQLSTFILINLLIVTLLASRLPTHWLSFTSAASAQHAGGGEGAYTVWHLIADIEAERHAAAEKRDNNRGRPRIPIEFPTTDPDEPTGRHHLRT